MATQQEKFQHLLRVLRQVKAQQVRLRNLYLLDMGCWLGRSDPGLRLQTDTFEEISLCGTATCAAGWAALDLWFNVEGLYLWRHDIAVDQFAYQAYFWDSIAASRTPYYVVTSYGFRALCIFFSITAKVAEDLFGYVETDEPDTDEESGDDPNSIDAVIARIEQFMQSCDMVAKQ